MIAVDTNVLIYAHRELAPQHGRALSRLSELAAGPAPWGIPVPCLREFLRLITHRRVFHPPYTASEAVEAVRRLTASPSLRLLSPGPRHLDLLLDMLVSADATGNLVFDASIAAVCIENGADRLLTEDRDFDRFSGLTVERLA